MLNEDYRAMRDAYFPMGEWEEIMRVGGRWYALYNTDGTQRCIRCIRTFSEDVRQFEKRILTLMEA